MFLLYSLPYYFYLYAHNATVIKYARGCRYNNISYHGSFWDGMLWLRLVVRTVKSIKHVEDLLRTFSTRLLQDSFLLRFPLTSNEDILKTIGKNFESLHKSRLRLIPLMEMPSGLHFAKSLFPKYCLHLSTMLILYAHRFICKT